MAPRKMRVLPMTSSWKAPRVPEPSSRVTTVMRLSAPPSGLPAGESPAKICLTSATLSPRTGFEGWTMMANPSRAMTISVRSFSSPLSSRDDMPIWQAPLLQAWMPALDPPPWTLTPEAGVPGHEHFGPFVGERLDARRAGQGQVVLGATAAASREKGDAEGQQAESEPMSHRSGLYLKERGGQTYSSLLFGVIGRPTPTDLDKSDEE